MAEDASVDADEPASTNVNEHDIASHRELLCITQWGRQLLYLNKEPYIYLHCNHKLLSIEVTLYLIAYAAFPSHL